MRGSPGARLGVTTHQEAVRVGDGERHRIETLLPHTLEAVGTEGEHPVMTRDVERVVRGVHVERVDMAELLPGRSGVRGGLVLCRATAGEQGHGHGEADDQRETRRQTQRFARRAHAHTPNEIE